MTVDALIAVVSTSPAGLVAADLTAEGVGVVDGTAVVHPAIHLALHLLVAAS